MHALRDCEGPVAGGLAASIGERMARFDPFHRGRQIGVRVRANGDRRANREMRSCRKRRRHRRRSFADRDHMQPAATDHFRDVRISKRSRDDTASADRVHTGADYELKIVPGRGNGNRQ